MSRKSFILILVLGFVVLGALNKSFADVGTENYHATVKEANKDTTDNTSKSLYRRFLDTLELGIKGYGGNMSYRQSYNTVPVESDWNAAFGKIDFDAKMYLGKHLIPSFTVGIFGSTVRNEHWNLKNANTYADNDTGIEGINLDGRLAYAINPDSRLVVTPYFSIGYRQFDINRSNFSNVAIQYTGIASNEQNIYLGYTGGGLGLDFNITDKLVFSTKGGCTYIFRNNVKDSFLGNFRGDGGYIADASIEIGYKLTDKLLLALGGFFEYQKQRRHNKLQNALINEWPDNELMSCGGTLRAAYKF